MAEMILPGVYIDVRAEGLIAAGQVTVGTIGIVGTASRGPVGEPVSLSSFAEARERFGDADAFVNGNSNELTLIRALAQAYNHGASSVVAVRVTGTAAAAAGENFIVAWNKNTTARKASFSVAGDTAATVAAVLKARTHGTWGNEIEVNVFDAEDDAFIVDERHPPGVFALTRKPIAQSPRNRVSVTLAATGQTKVFGVVYVAPTPGQVQINTATGVLTFAAGEAPVAGDILRASYAVPAANSRKVTLRYPGVAETYTVSDGGHLVDLVNAADSPSAIVVGTAGANPAEHPKKHATADDFRQFGKGTDQPGGDGAAANDGDYKLGLDQLLNEDAHLIVAAGRDDAIADELKAHCEAASSDKIRRDRIGIVGSKVGATFNDIRGHTLASDRLVFVAPGIKATDDASGKDVTLPGAYAAAAIAGMLASRDPEVSLTNKVLAVPGLETKFTSAQLEQLVQAHVLALEVRRGFRVVKGITTDDGAFRQISVRRIVDYAKYGVRSASEPYIGLLNNDRVRKALKGTINGFLAGMVDDEMLITYEVDVTATRDEEKQGIAKVTMTLEPTFSIDYIKVVMFLQ